MPIELRVTGAPVMRGERVVGVVSQSDLLRARDDTDSVEDVMTKTVYAVLRQLAVANTLNRTP
jgi:CBS domain-containing protein